MLAPLLHDRMTQTLLDRDVTQDDLFAVHAPAALRTIPLLREGLPALERADRELGLALSADEMAYLAPEVCGRDSAIPPMPS